MKQLIRFLVVLLCLAAQARAAGGKTFSVTDFGAKGDGETKDTAAIQKALDACAENGGGTVIVPAGIYLTGSIILHGHTTLQLASRANLLGSADIADYPLENIRWEGEFTQGHRALISASSAESVAITGGAIFGPPITVSKLRNPRGPALIELTGCTNVLLEKFTTQYQQLWSIHTLFCRNFIAQNLTIRSVNFNGDGIDVDSCSGVTIDHCDINTGDDAISLKSGRGLAAQKLGRPTENVAISDCRLQSSLFAALGLGSEMSGGIRNVKIENCVISGHQNAVLIKSREGRGGFMEDISFDNITVLKSPTFIGIDLVKRGIQATDPVPGDVEKWARVQNLSFKNISVQGVTALIDGIDIPVARPINGFTFSGITGTCDRAIAIANMTNVVLSKIEVTGYKGQLVTAKNVSGSGLDQAAAAN